MTDKAKKRDFSSDQDVRWCPGCGDYSILASMKKFLVTQDCPHENLVFISGIGCSGRFPYYLNTYGFHTIHGRAPAIATGLKLTRPELSVWIVTGDGDALSIGTNHFIHLIRRNIDVNILLFNNRIYGLTKGQYSPTSEVGIVTKSTPAGSIEQPLEPLSVALAANAGFVARVVDTDAKGLQKVLQAAAQYRGTAVIEVYQNCPIFNETSFDGLHKKADRLQNTLWVEHEQPLIFGQEPKQALILKDFQWQLTTALDQALVYNAQHSSIAPAQMLCQLRLPQYPYAMGIFRNVPRQTYDEVLQARHAATTRKSLKDLIAERPTWTVGRSATPTSTTAEDLLYD